jgi:hypothetical protein
MNTAAVTLGLAHASYPLVASIAEGCAAGLQSAVLQVSCINARYALFLSGSRSERQRFVRWASLSALYLALMKLAGILFGGGPTHLPSLAAAYGRTLLFGGAQYPWVAAIALRRRLEGAVRGRCPERIRLTADLQTMAVSASCVCVSALNSVGVPSSRLWLLVAGALGLIYYQAVRTRWARWRRRTAVPSPASGRTIAERG